MSEMLKSQFKIREIEPGIPDIGFINKMNSDEFTIWIRARLSGLDPHYPLNEYRGESRLELFIWIFENTDEHEFRTEFHLALKRILTKEVEKSYINKSKPEKLFFYYLIDLIGHFYATYNQAESTGRKNAIHNRIEEILVKICDPNGALSKDSDTYLRALYALSEVEGEPVLDWEQIFRMKDGIYSAAAFGAIAKRDPIHSIELLPEFICAAERNPDKVSLDEEIFTLFDNNENNSKRMAAIIENISKVFHCKSRELGILKKELTELGLDTSKWFLESNAERNNKAIHRIFDRLRLINSSTIDKIAREITCGGKISNHKIVSLPKRRIKNEPCDVEIDLHSAPFCDLKDELVDETSAEQAIKPWMYDPNEIDSFRRKPCT